MTGDELYEKLGNLTPEQRKLEVVCRAHDVGRDRATICNSSGNHISIERINGDGFEADDDDDDANDCIVIPT